MQEIFKDIVGYEGLYRVSNLGRVYNVRYNRFLKPGTLRNGYLLVVLCRNGAKSGRSVHRLVAEAFLENPLNLPEVNHKDRVRAHNSVDNLEWCDGFYNQQYSNGKRAIQTLNGVDIAEFSCIKSCTFNRMQALKY